MKVTLHGIILLDCTFRHSVEPFGGVKVEGPHPESPVAVEVELAKAEQPHQYVIKLKTVMDDPGARYAMSVTYAVMLSVDLEGAAAPENLDSRMMATGATMAFPYTREIISSLSSRGRFGAVWLKPQNFNEIIAGPKQQETEAATAPTK